MTKLVTPRDKVQKLLDEANAAWNSDLKLETLINYYRKNGVVIDRDECFCLARPMPLSEIDHWFDLNTVWAIEDCDTWSVLLASGDLRYVVRYAPFKLHYVQWYRQKNSSLHYTTFDRLSELVNKHYV